MSLGAPEPEGSTVEVLRPLIHSVLKAKSTSVQGARLTSLSLFWPRFALSTRDGYRPVLPFAYSQDYCIALFRMPSSWFLSLRYMPHANSSQLPVPSCNSPLSHPPFLALNGNLLNSAFPVLFPYCLQWQCRADGEREGTVLEKRALTRRDASTLLTLPAPPGVALPTWNKQAMGEGGQGRGPSMEVQPGVHFSF